MARLKCKSIRGDAPCSAAEWDPYWSWAPDRAIKIKAVSWSLDQPNDNGTSWVWLSRGSVAMIAPADSVNEEEMIISAIHQRSESPGGIEAVNNTLFADFGADHMDVLDGEKLYINVRGTVAKNIGITCLIYYL